MFLSFFFPLLLGKSLYNTEVVLGKQKYQDTWKIFSVGLYKLRTIQRGSNKKNSEYLPYMFSEEF